MENFERLAVQMADTVVDILGEIVRNGSGFLRVKSKYVENGSDLLYLSRLGRRI